MPGELVLRHSQGPRPGQNPGKTGASFSGLPGDARARLEVALRRTSDAEAEHERQIQCFLDAFNRYQLLPAAANLRRAADEVNEHLEKVLAAAAELTVTQSDVKLCSELLDSMTK